ncbi:hypothetical protein EDB83DRAFT_2554869 [Lactarius deliciosus]|nr:hypothetical protein EDB83DRAFT_2554869 [Lactarius deliciosus]
MCRATFLTPGGRTTQNMSYIPDEGSLKLPKVRSETLFVYHTALAIRNIKRSKQDQVTTKPRKRPAPSSHAAPAKLGGIETGTSADVMATELSEIVHRAQDRAGSVVAAVVTARECSCTALYNVCWFHWKVTLKKKTKKQTNAESTVRESGVVVGSSMSRISPCMTVPRYSLLALGHLGVINVPKSARCHGGGRIEKLDPRFRPKDPPTSITCPCGWGLRDPPHLISSCPRYLQQRINSAITGQHFPLSYSQLFTTSKGAKRLMNYLATSRAGSQPEQGPLPENAVPPDDVPPEPD